MSRTSRYLEFHFVVEDPEYWTPERRAEAEADTSTSSYDCWVANQLYDVMYKAGQRFMDEHQDLFDPAIELM